MTIITQNGDTVYSFNSYIYFDETSKDIKIKNKNHNNVVIAAYKDKYYAKILYNTFYNRLLKNEESFIFPKDVQSLKVGDLVSNKEYSEHYIILSIIGDTAKVYNINKNSSNKVDTKSLSYLHMLRETEYKDIDLNYDEDASYLVKYTDRIIFNNRLYKLQYKKYDYIQLIPYEYFDITPETQIKDKNLLKEYEIIGLQHYAAYKGITISKVNYISYNY